MNQLDDEVVDGSTVEVEKVDGDSDKQQPPGLEEVEAWLADVALCLNLSDGRRWIDP